MLTDDPYDLQRFLQAQGPVIERVLAELDAGHKVSHWMWFAFPQLQGLGRSEMARYYGIASRAEGRAYWSHGVLGPRLKDCTLRVLAVPGRSALQIFGEPDNRKFRSCMTLFAHVAPEEPAFAEALEKYFDGVPDERTLDRLGSW